MKALLFLLPLSAAAQTYTAEWDWPVADVCSYLWPPVCVDGYVACIDAQSSAAAFNGQPAGIGEDIEACATLYSGSNGAMGTWYWTVAPDGSHVLQFDAVAMVAVVVDSITARFRSDDSQAAAVSYSIDGGTEVPINALPGAPFWLQQQLPVNVTVPAASVFRVVVRAQPGALPSDAWWLDFVRIIAHPDMSTGVPDLASANVPVRTRAFDVLGRPVNASAAAGVYTSGQRRYVVLFQ